MSTLMFWNKQNANANQANGGSGDAKNGKKEWLHSPDALVNGHVAYLVKFLGATPVDQAKGIETVKDAIRRLQFAQQIKKSEGGNNHKSKKVEITISVDGVAVQEPRVTKALHQFPLHDISYCADEKGVKKFFSFIAKTNTNAKNAIPNGDTSTVNTNNNNNSSAEDTHTCFVFVSSKLASDITMTIGQAFDLAYRRYVSDGTKTTELSKMQFQQKQLEHSVSVYQQRLKDLVELLPKADVARFLSQYGVRDLLEVVPLADNNNGNVQNHVATLNGHKTAPEMGIDILSMHHNNDNQMLIETSSPNSFSAPKVPPRNQLQNQINNTFDALKPSVGTKLEGLLLNSDSDSDFDPRAEEESDNSSTTNGGGSSNGGQSKLINDLFGFEPPQQRAPATLGQQLFPAVPLNGVNGTVNGSLSNGLTNGHGNGGNTYQMNPTPLLAPPPKAATPRRSAAPQNHNINSQDLFGSTPFDALQPSPFNAPIPEDPSTTETTNDPFSVTLNNLTTSTPYTSNPFGDTGIESGRSMTKNSGFDEESFDLGFSTGDSFTSPNQQHDSNDLKGLNFAAPPPTQHFAKEAPTKVSPDYSHIDYNSFHIAKSSAELASSTMMDNQTPKKPLGFANASSLDADFFQSAAASAFKQFGSPSPSKPTTVVSPQKRSLVSISADVVSPPQKSNQIVMGNSYGSSFEKNNFNAKTLAFDDFTLESLDPLRK